MTTDGPTSNRPRAGSTIDDVARAAGVSTATVSRALRGLPNVAPATRAKVQEAARRLAFVANPHAARLASGTTHTVGLLAPLLTGWFTSEVLAGVEEVLSGSGYDLLVGTTATNDGERLVPSDSTPRQRVDGLLLVDPFRSEGKVALHSVTGAPTVVLGDRAEGLHSVGVDHLAGGALAARHLLALGHRRIALVDGPSRTDTAHHGPDDRRAGFLGALRDEGFDVPAALRFDGGFHARGGCEAMRHLLSLDDAPTAVFLLSDEMAFGALQALREAGLRAGTDVSVIGFDDHSSSESVGLTTVRQPVRDIGRVGAHTLLGELAGPTAPTHTTLDVELVHRASTGATGDTTRALR